MARPAACLFAALLGLTGGPARAATVVLVHADSPAGPRWPLAEQRVRDELRALGMTVAEARPRSTDDGAMAALLAEHAAVVAVQISRTSDRGDVTLWLAEPAPRRVSLALADGQHAGIAALRAAELVHTETREGARREPAADAPLPESPLVPLPPWTVATTNSTAAPIPPPPSADATPPASASPSPPLTAPPAAAIPPLPAPTATPPLAPQLPSEFVDDLPPATADLGAPPPAPSRRHGLLVAGNVGGGPGGTGVLPGLELAARRELTRRLEFGGGVFSLVSPTWRSDPRGAIRFGLVAARVQLGFRWQLAPRLSLRLALGGGLALGWAVGRADSPFRSATSISPVGVLSGGVTFVVPLGPRISLHAGAAADILLPSLSVRSAGVEAFRLGLPLLRGVLGIAWDWPLRRP
ncbi:hypothetical protein [Nannocystis pusilla]|uniref:Uncharacterized protein n=1 Tax=Nannocystis pusilla TaxID=889268 RepID=A0ABS7THU9_9BACT|nr:hypothetical protein [Nannocystis pusilla]MBZ5707789.1 hypothetical protein [Nannocystis pusilla]